MDGIDAMVAISMLIVLMGGIVIGVVVVVSVASRREDSLYSLPGEAPGVLCRGARRLLGVWTRGGWPVDVAPEPDDGAPRREAYR